MSGQSSPETYELFDPLRNAIRAVPRRSATDEEPLRARDIKEYAPITSTGSGRSRYPRSGWAVPPTDSGQSEACPTILMKGRQQIKLKCMTQLDWQC